MDLHLHNKVALVTGATRGLGKAIALSLAAEGASIAINYRREPEVAQALAAEASQRFGVRALAVMGDVSSEPDVAAMYDQIQRELGMVEILVNNAAYCPTAPVAELSLETWEQTFRVNMTGTFLCCKHMVQRLLAANRAGKIVNISSQAAFRGSQSGHAPYDASKGSIISFTISLARELAGKGFNVNCVAPGMMLTEMVLEKVTRNYEKYIERIPLRRIGKVEEIADVVTFLCSDRAAYMTGATVDVSGGLAMH